MWQVDSVEGEHRDSKEMKAIAVISQRRSKGRPDTEVDDKGTREEGSDRTVEPVGPVTTSLDVREQGAGLRNRTKVWSYDRICFISREVEKPSPEKGLRVKEGVPAAVKFEAGGSPRQPGPDVNVRILCEPLGMNEREDREEKQELGQNLQGQLNLEDLERESCQLRRQSRMVRDGSREGTAQRTRTESRGWDSPAGLVLNKNELVSGMMKFPKVPS